MDNEAQIVFDRVARHLLTQRQRSYVKGIGGGIGMCRYRGPNGLRCAAGILIPDKSYREGLEGQNVGNYDVRCALEPAAQNHIALLRDLQNVHDNHHTAAWPKMLTKVASLHQLSADMVEAFAPEGGDWRPLSAV